MLPHASFLMLGQPLSVMPVAPTTVVTACCLSGANMYGTSGHMYVSTLGVESGTWCEVFSVILQHVRARDIEKRSAELL